MDKIGAPSCEPTRRDEVFTGATFMPVDQPLRSSLLLEEISRERQAALAVISMIMRNHGRDELASLLMEQLRRPPQARRAFVEAPEVRIWLKLAIRALGLGPLPAPEQPADLDGLGREFARLPAKLAEPCARVPGTELRLLRHEVDPLLAAMIPPSYEFPSEQELARPPASASSLDLAGEAIARALARIGEHWPALGEDIPRFVRCIIHVTGVGFRSCSAERYTGAVLLTDSDTTLIDLEESIVHEYGHQILYNVMELCPLLTNPSDDRQFELPWSGSKRDRYGYFHAFYIYTLLALYFERISGRPELLQERIEARLRGIVIGLLKARPDFRPADFTARGQQLLGQVAAEIDGLASRRGISASAAATAPIPTALAPA